jgi:hypothetical protein
VAERRSAIHCRTSPKSGPNGPTSPSVTTARTGAMSAEDPRCTSSRLDAELLAAPGQGLPHERRAAADHARRVSPPLVEAAHDLLTGASATEFGLFTFAATTCDCPATISDRWAVQPDFLATRRARSGGRPRRCDHGDGRGRSASTGPSPQRHSPDDSVLEDGWPTTPLPRSARVTTG